MGFPLNSQAIELAGWFQVRILVIEKDRRTFGLLRAALSSASHALHAASSQEEGLLEVERWNPEIILMDVEGPSLDGVAICRGVRETSKVPIIALTANRNTDAMVAVLDAGADDYVSKPFSVPELHARIRTWSRRLRN